MEPQDIAIIRKIRAPASDPEPGARIRCILLLILAQHSALLLTVILAHPITDFRCSHLPDTSEQVTHVWLNSANFSASQDDYESQTPVDLSNKSQRFDNNKSKRHVEPKKSSSLRQSLHEDPVLNTLDTQHSGQEKSNLVPIKIQVHYDSSVYLLDKNRLDLIIDRVMPSVVKFFESVLSIRQDYTIGRFRISRRCPNNTMYYAKDVIGQSRAYCMDRCENYATCGEIIVPQAHLSACSYCNSSSKRCMTNHASAGKGVPNAQLLLYVSAKQTARCRKDATIAYAAHCAQDSITDRPVAGHANLCPASISTEPKDLKALIATVKHELTHVLGFSVSLFAYYRDKNGNPLTERDTSPGPIPVDPETGYAKWSDKVIKKFLRKGWVSGEGEVDKEVNMIVTPTVVREVRSHFNCSTLEGAELEDQGSDGTSMTHWEKRLFENEAMTGTHTQNSVFSRLTLAVLQDTGWYVANFSRAEQLIWGKDLGCDFAMRSCKSWIHDRRAKGASIRPFCDVVKGELLQITCTEDRTSKAVCNMKHYEDPLPLAYRNFDQLEGVTNDSLAHYGGSVDLADFCPFIQEFTWQAQNVTVRGSRCDLTANYLEAERNAALEYYGPQARCFEHGRRWDQRSCIYKRHWHHYGAGCYKYSCSNGNVNIMIGNHSYPCFYNNQHIDVELVVDQWLYNGTLVCPACEDVCPPHKCKYHDRRIIDKILNLNFDFPAITKAASNNALEALVEDAINSIDSKYESDHDNNYNNLNPFFRQKTSNINSNNSLESNHKPKVHKSYREVLLQLFARNNEQTRQTLVCSRANHLAGGALSRVTLALISFMITVLNLSPRPRWPRSVLLLVGALYKDAQVIVFGQLEKFTNVTSQ